jgi:hypothetical protein
MGTHEISRAVTPDLVTGAWAVSTDTERPWTPPVGEGFAMPLQFFLVRARDAAGNLGD